MAKVTYDKQLTALLVIDLYDDFISEGGKIWDRLKGVAEANKCVPHMMQVFDAARKRTSRFVCAAPSIPPWRLRDFELHCAGSEGSVGAKELRIRQRGAARSAANSNLKRATSWPSSIGVAAALPTLISICSSTSTASISSSSSDSWPIRAWSPPCALPLSLATRSRR